MGECICNNCKNLKSVINEENGESDFECKFGFPSSECENCNEDECEKSCANFVEDSDEVEYQTVYCKGCNKEISKIVDESDSDADIYCVDCYLKK